MAWTTATTRSTGFSVTAAVWNAEHVDNMNFLKEVAYQEFTADVTSSSTTVGTATQIVSAGAITFEAVPHLIELWCSRAFAGTAQMNVILRDSTTVLGTVALAAGSSSASTPFHAFRRITPTAASHTYNFAVWNASAATATFKAGTGGAAGDGSTLMPGYIRITKVPT